MPLEYVEYAFFSGKCRTGLQSVGTTCEQCPVKWGRPPDACGPASVGGILETRASRGGDPSFLDANYTPPLTVGRRPGGGGGGGWEGGFWEGRRGGVGEGGSRAGGGGGCRAPPNGGARVKKVGLRANTPSLCTIGRLWRQGADRLLGLEPLTTDCWPEASWGGGRGGGVVGILGAAEPPPPPRDGPLLAIWHGTFFSLLLE